MSKIPPPFYENFDDTHCFQCTFREILEYFEPDEVWDWQTWDEFTNKEPNKWTWPYRGRLNLLKRGYITHGVAISNISNYLKNGIYPELVKKLGTEAANKQKEMADLNKVEADIHEIIKHPSYIQEVRVPTIKDIKKFLNSNFLVRSIINSRTLNGKDGYISHAVLIYDIDDKFVYMHDSGLPPKPERKVPIETYIKASTTPTEAVWSITGYKKT